MARVDATDTGHGSGSLDRKTGCLTGIHAATITPMRADFSLDETALADHLIKVTSGTGVKGLLINGHAGENFLLSREEKQRVTEISRAVLGPDVFLTSGINAECSLDAARHAADQEAAGADALLVFPPNAWGLFQDSDAAMIHHGHVRDACALPLLLYQAPVGAGAMPYPVATLTRLIADPRVIAIKEGSWEVATYEENRHAVKAKRPDIAVLGSGDEHLLTSYLIGSEGSQVSLAAICPEPVVALWEAASAGRFDEARNWHDVIYPLAAAIYRSRPGGRATPRLKACLKILGRLACDAARPPFQPLDREEYRRLEAALKHAGVDR